MIGRLCERMSNGENREQLMNTEWLRFESSKELPENVPISSTKFAKEGLYYVGNGQNDEVKCFSCKNIIRGWKELDDPSERHKRVSSNCEFVRGIDGNNIPIHVPNELQTNSVTSFGDGAVAEVVNDSSDIHRGDMGMLQYTLDNPKFPQYRNYSARVDTYREVWSKEDVVRSVTLAKAGFFFAGFGDCVRCFQCGIGLRNWDRGDDPWKEHVKIYKWCRHLLDEKGQSFIQQYSEDEPTDVLETPYNSSNDSTVNKIKSDHLVKRKIARKSTQGRSENERNGKSDNEQQDGTNTLEGDKAVEESLTFTEMKVENERLNNVIMCQVCLVQEVNIVFLPCGHLVSCQMCAPQIKKCAICRTPIEGRKKIFLA